MRLPTLAMILFGISIEAQAFDFAISNFTVLKNGETMFTDSFTGTTPPAAPKYNTGSDASYYLPAGSFSPAVGGKLHLNSAAATLSPAVSSRLGVAAHLTTNIETSSTAGLKPGSSFEVIATWDAITPADTKETYFIELGDWQNSACDDCIRTGVFKNADGTVEIQFWRNLIANDEIKEKVVLGTAPFTPGDNRQIRLRLKKTDKTSNAVRASYAYIDNGVVGTEVDLPGQTDIFTSRGYSRAAFKAFAPAAYGKSSGTNKDLSLTANINVDNSHAGKTGNIYVVAIYQGWVFVHNGSTWVSWDPATTLPAYATNVSLSDRSINVLDKLDVSSLVGTTILVGYARDQDDLINNKAYEVVHTVQ
ncbi:MAG: hypothetical protein HY850_01220 [Betaproteobacteria bacterium]|nr:hypothetical protein [Betaproteobacteria bacterium]